MNDGVVNINIGNHSLDDYISGVMTTLCYSHFKPTKQNHSIIADRRGLSEFSTNRQMILSRLFFTVHLNFKVIDNSSLEVSYQINLVKQFLICLFLHMTVGLLFSMVYSDNFTLFVLLFLTTFTIHFYIAKYNSTQLTKSILLKSKQEMVLNKYRQ